MQMPLEALFAVTALESVAHGCVVIGEDLGTVPEGFREQMADWGIWSYQVVMFERDAQVWATGHDSRGVTYALLELADRVRHADEPIAALAVPRRIAEKPANRISSVTRLFTSEVEDKPWFNDREMWPA